MDRSEKCVKKAVRIGRMGFDVKERKVGFCGCGRNVTRDRGKR